MVRKLAAEGVGTALLAAAVVGSGIMAERLAGGNGAIALMANAIATGVALVALILTFGPVSGAHFNPLVTVILKGPVLPFSIVQILGAVLGTVAANLMFGLAVLGPSRHVRTGWGLWGSEALATFGLLGVILATRNRPAAAAIAVATYITGAYWFTSSTSFANPAITIGRCLTDSFAGIHPSGVLPFIGAQIVGAAAATVFFGWLFKGKASE